MNALGKNFFLFRFVLFLLRNVLINYYGYMWKHRSDILTP